MSLVIKEYFCENCGDFEDLQQHNKMHTRCPKCDSAEIERLISKPIVAKDGGPRTIGSQIELNNKRNPLTREKIFGPDAEKKMKQREKMEKLQNMSTEQKNKYIETGQL